MFQIFFANLQAQIRDPKHLDEKDSMALWQQQRY